MRERLYEYLAEQASGGSASSEELLALILHGRGSDEAFGRAFLAGLLSDDPRFVQDTADGGWQLADDHVLETALSEAPFVVVDLESTGQRPEHTGITEIGALRFEGRREVGRFQSLVNPGSPIPPYVAKLTGIDDGMVADAPSIDELMPEFARFAADSVLVAHNAAFDAKVLDHASRMILDRPLGLPTLCTFKLARRVVPELDRASLDSLAEHFDLHTASRHRAMADAELTAVVLARFLDMLEAEGAATVGDLLTAQEEGDEPRRLEILVTRHALESLPESRGVYWLVDADDQTLFVGQAANVREHVSRLYLDTAHLSGRQLEMVSAVVDVGCRETVSDLETFFVEADEMRARKPLYNRAGRHLPRGSFVKIARRGAFPRVSVAGRINGDGALYLGPIKGKAFADDASAMLARLYRLRTCPGRLTPDPAFEPCELGPAGLCTSPCDASVDSNEYRRQVHELERDLSGDGSRLKQLASGGSEPGRDAGLLGRLMKLQRRRHWLVNEHSYLAAFPTSDPALMVVAVLEGLCRGVTRITTAAELDAFLETVAARGRGAVRSYEADVSTIMAHWVRRSQADDCLIVDLDDDEDRAASLARAGKELAPLVDSLS